MRTTSSVVAAALLPFVSAQSVSGSAEGFASGVTGGGDADVVTPTSTDELVSYLTDSSPRVIYLTQEFDFTGTEGTTTEDGCAPWGTDSACQTAINKDDWCSNYQSDAPTVSVSYDNAGLNPIEVTSDKTIIGEGTSGVIKGKGLRLANGVENVIIQNIHITELNPQYVWGGDAITLAGTDLIWIDHVKTSLIGRQHIVLGEDASGRVTISNSEIDGETSWSATCDGYHYWSMYFTGSDDQITLKGNYVHHTSGRAPKVQGGTLLHAVNNYFYESSGHDFETADGATILAEGNVFTDVNQPIENGGGLLYARSSDDSACSNYIGRSCVANLLTNSGSFDGSDGSVMDSFKGQTVADADDVSNVESSVTSNAGVGKI